MGGDDQWTAERLRISELAYLLTGPRRPQFYQFVKLFRLHYAESMP